MADKHDSIDPTTLAEVQRLLTSTKFASAEDLVARSGEVETFDLPPSSAADQVLEAAEPTAPLPKRR